VTQNDINILLHLDSRKGVQRAEPHFGRLRVEARAGGHVDSKDERVVLWRQLVDAPVEDLHRAQMTWPTGTVSASADWMHPMRRALLDAAF